MAAQRETRSDLELESWGNFDLKNLARSFDFDLNEVAQSFGFDLNDLELPDFDLSPFFDRCPAFDFDHFDHFDRFFDLPDFSLEGLPGAANLR